MRINNLLKIILLILTAFLFSTESFSQWKKCSGKYRDLSVFSFIEVDQLIMGSTKQGIIISEDGFHWDSIVEFGFPI